MLELVLASTSPRRRQLLEQAGYVFRTSSVKVSEIPEKNLNLPEQIQDLARRKALACIQSNNWLKIPGYLVLGADTVVVLDGEILGKPENKNENFMHLRRLSGKKHGVITGVCLVESGSKRDICFHDESIIEFHPLSDDQIRKYVQTDDGLDKAGGYGIQGEAGKFVKAVTGSFSNVVGLPVEKLKKVIEDNGWQLRR